MLRAVYTHKFSILRNLSNLLKDAPRGETLSSATTFYRDEVEVAGLYNYRSKSEIEVEGELLSLKVQKRVVLFSQHQTETQYSAIVNPGIRWAHNFPSGLQIVPGVSFPIGFGPSNGSRGVFFYLSFEHPFKKE
jgi:hypothetical protein